jgi:hypothetical protein
MAPKRPRQYFGRTTSMPVTISEGSERDGAELKDSWEKLLEDSEDKSLQKSEIGAYWSKCWAWEFILGQKGIRPVQPVKAKHCSFYCLILQDICMIAYEKRWSTPSQTLSKKLKERRTRNGWSTNENQWNSCLALLDWLEILRSREKGRAPTKKLGHRIEDSFSLRESLIHQLKAPRDTAPTTPDVPFCSFCWTLSTFTRNNGFRSSRVYEPPLTCVSQIDTSPIQPLFAAPSPPELPRLSAQ